MRYLGLLLCRIEANILTGEKTMIILKSFATPIIWVLTFLALGLILSKSDRRKILSRIGWWAVLVGTLMLLVFSLWPVAHMLVYSLEYRHSSPSSEVVETLNVIVVLGAASYPSGGLRAEAELSGIGYSRLYKGVSMFRRSGASVLALCGCGLGGDTESDAEVMKTVAINLGIPEDRILIETKSRTTMENAIRLAELLPRGQIWRIGLVTSATHMLRAEKVFSRQFPEHVIVPIPTNYRYDQAAWSAKHAIPSVRAIEQSTVALHEWVGILWYSLRYW